MYIEPTLSKNKQYIIHSFSQATDKEITEYLEMHKAGDIDLTKYWSVGEKRTIPIGTLGSLEIPYQDVEFTILNGPGRFELSNDEGGGYNTFVIGMTKQPLQNVSKYFFNSSATTNAGGWKESELRPWCNTVFRDALPTEVKKWFKKFKNTANDGGNVDTYSEFEDYFTVYSTTEAIKLYNMPKIKNNGITKGAFDYIRYLGTIFEYNDTTNYVSWSRDPYENSASRMYTIRGWQYGYCDITGTNKRPSLVAVYGVV